MAQDPEAYASSVPRRFLDSTDYLLLVQHALESDPETREAPIDIIARGGTITLLGQVSTASLKQAAERAVRSISGVGEVDNQIEVREETMHN